METALSLLTRAAMKSTSLRSIILVWILGVATPAAAAPSQPALRAREACLSRTHLLLGGASRKGSASCWVELRTEQGEALCLSRALWNSWLDAPDPWLCGSWQGPWRIFSPPENEPHALLEKKKIRTQWIARHASSLRSPQPSRTGFPQGSLLAFRQAIEKTRERTSEILTPLDSLGILRALVLNEKSPTSPTPLLRRLGLVHLLTATGIHLYALASFWSATSLALARTLGIPLRIALPLSRILSFLTWSYAWLLCGSRLGMFRPWIVVMARHGALHLGFRWRKWAPLALALGADAVMASVRTLLQGEDWSGPDSGRWLYALAVGGGMLGDGRKSHLRLAIGSWAFAALFELWKDGLVATATPLLSLVSIPIYCALIYPALLGVSVACTLDFQVLAESATGLLAPLASGLTLHLLKPAVTLDSLWLVPRETLPAALLLSLAWLAWNAGPPRVWRQGALLIAGALFCIYRAAPAIEPPLAGAPRIASEVQQLDVGQGDAALVLAPGDAGLIDAGSERALNDEGWLLLLASRRITELQWIALTHLDEDHIGGLRRLKHVIPIRCVATSRAELKTPQGQALRNALAETGIPLVPWQVPCVPYSVRPPVPDTPDPRPRHGNSRMSALLIPIAREGVYLNAGDAPEKDEPAIARWARDLLQANPGLAPGPRRILKLSHHGSNTSTAPALLRIFRPTEAWISAGNGNPHGHPTARIIERLREFGIFSRRTDSEGRLFSR